MASLDECTGLVLSLAGTFSLRTAQGRPVEIAGEYPKRLIALLARSRNGCRSREQLIDLLWDNCSDPAASLRQLRHQVATRIAEHGGAIGVSGNVVSLQGVRDITARPPIGQVEFFEDAGFGTETFEDWLRTERMAFLAEPAGPAPAIKRPRLRIGLAVPFLNGVDTVGAVIAELLANSLRDIFIASDFVSFSDLRQTPRQASELDALVELRVVQVGNIAEISFAALGAEDRLCLFSLSMRVRADRSFSPGRRDVAQFLMNVVAGIERAAARAARVDLRHWNEAPLYEIVTRMFRMTKADVIAATDALDTYATEQNPASALAWRAFGKMLLSGEKLVEQGAPAVEEAGDLIAHALETDPMNPTALAVAAHFASFVERDFVRAAWFSDASIAIAPHSPFARDVRAMLELYAGRMQAGTKQARLAAQLSHNGPLRHYVEGSLVVAATLTGEHAFAVARGREILRARPNFLPVMRHMFASYAILGDHEAARQLCESIRRIDPAFGTADMKAAGYGLPSEKSREIITHATRLLERARSGGRT